MFIDRFVVAGLVCVAVLAAAMAPADQGQDKPQESREQRIEQLQSQIQAETQAMEKLAQEVRAGERDIASYADALQPHIKQITELQSQLQTLMFKQYQEQIKEMRRELDEEEAAAERKTPDEADGKPREPPSLEQTLQEYQSAWMRLALHLQDQAVQQHLGQSSEADREAAGTRLVAIQERHEALSPSIELVAREIQRRHMRAMGVESPQVIEPADEQALREAQEAMAAFAKEVRGFTARAVDDSSGRGEKND